MGTPTPKQNIQLGTLRCQLQNKTFNQGYKDGKSKTNKQLGTWGRQLQNKTFNQEHKDANSKTKHSTRNIKTANPKQINQLGT